MHRLLPLLLLVFLAVPAPAAQVTDQVAQSWVRAWRARLQIPPDWDIGVQIVGRNRLDKGVIARVTWRLAPRRHATIYLLAERERGLPACELLYDAELSVVHELLHLKLATLNLNDEVEEERIVKELAHALLDAPGPLPAKGASLTGKK